MNEHLIWNLLSTCHDSCIYIYVCVCFYINIDVYFFQLQNVGQGFPSQWRLAKDGTGAIILEFNAQQER